MDTLVTLSRLTPSQYDLLREAVSDQLAAVTLRTKEAPAGPEKHRLRQKAFLLSELAKEVGANADPS